MKGKDRHKRQQSNNAGAVKMHELVKKPHMIVEL